jgi:GT2 family glycosyltransferase
MKIALVILNWNGEDLLREFLPSVVKYSDDRSNIYVVDNASDDDSVSFIKNNFQEIKIIQNNQNGGYAKGYNDSLKQLNEDLFILLNNDVEVTPNWLDSIIKEFENDPDLVAAQPKILDFNNKDFFEYAGAAGGFIDRLGYPYCRGRIFNTIEMDTGQFDDTIPIFWATGACLVVLRDAFMEVEGFDEDLFTHQEEIDLCWRMKANGGGVKYIGSSSVYHVGGATLPSASPRKTFYNFRNTLLVLLKNVKGSEVWILLLFRLVLDGFAGLLFLIQGKPKHIIAIIKSHLSFYLLIPSYLKKRKNVGSNLKYYHTKSVVWKYFAIKKRIFKEL